jgi:Uma2 family endonuclease
MPAAPLRPHQRILLRLGAHLLRFFEKNPIGEVFPAPVDVRLATHFVYQPDLVVLLKENPLWEQRDAPGPLNGPPDLVIEILSPSSRFYDSVEKAANYASYGVREYWIVDLERESIDIRVLRDGALVSTDQKPGTARSTVIDGLTVNVSELFTAVR